MNTVATERVLRLAMAAGLGGMIMVGVGCDSGSDAGAAAGDGGAATAEAASDAFVVQTVNYPLAYFAERISGGHCQIEFLAPADGDPAFWMPDRDSIVRLQSADLILANGATYAKWMGGVSLPTSKIVDTSASFASAYIEVEDSVVHSHGVGGEHSHGGTAFTTWLDMTQARAQAEAVRDALIEGHGEHADDFRANADALLADIDALDAELVAVGESLAGTPLIGSHPVYQYLSRRYGLSLEALHWEPEMTITEENLAELAELRDRHAAGWMVWEGEPTAEAVAALEGVGVRSVVFDPAGNRPDEGDWLSVMRANVEALRSVAEGG
ncbi:MAG: metal ABC transporter substrate-binding protein [Planctomycetota bacterium]